MSGIRGPMMRVLAAAVALSAAAVPAFAQEYIWVESRFHRVYLHNGNFIDGNVLAVSQRDVHLRMSAGEMIIRKDTIDRIELLKMRSILEKPKLDPPLKKAPAAAGGVAAPGKRALTAFPPAEASEELISNVAAFLSRLKIAKPDQKDGLVEGLARLENAGGYLASLMPTLDEEPCYMVRSALIRSKDAEAVPYLVRALDSDRPFVQINALTLLGVVGTPAVAPNIRPLLGHASPVIRATAIETLQQLHDEGSLELISDFVTDEDATLRVPAIAAALELGLKFDRMDVIADRIRRGLAGSQGRVAKELLGAAARCRRADLWERVASFLSDPDPVLRRTAAAALGALAAPESAFILKSRIYAEDDSRTLVELAKASAAVKSAEILPALIELLAKSESSVVKAASEALASLTGEKFGDNRLLWLEWMDRNAPRK